MKIFFSTLTLGVLASFASHATCTSAAIWAAESEYGNDPAGPSKVKIISPGAKYIVIVGENNVEDGAHTYSVVFQNGICNPSSTQVTEISK